jgi:hypothetical protein
MHLTVNHKESTMTIKPILAGMVFMFTGVSILGIEPAIAFREIPIKGTYTRGDVSAVCRHNGGIETGTTPGTTGGFGCITEDSGSISCTDKGKCVFIPPTRTRNPAPNQPRPALQSELEAILGGR